MAEYASGHGLPRSEGPCTDECRRITVDPPGIDPKTVAVGTEISLVMEKVCDHVAPYRGGEHTDHIRVHRQDDPSNILWPRWVAAKVQCYDCRRQYGRWWLVGAERMLPTEEAVRTRFRGMLEAAGFERRGEGWLCPDLPMGESAVPELSEGAAPDPESWED